MNRKLNIQTSHQLTRHLLHFSLGFVTGISAYLYLTFNLPTWTNQVELTILSGFIGVFASYIIEFSSDQIGQRTRWKENPGLSLLASLLINFVLVTGLLTLYMHFGQRMYAESVDELSQIDYVKIAILSFLAMLIYSIVYFAYRSFQYFHLSSLEHIQLETRQIDLQLMALKSQLSPHFLFNSLNTISSLIQSEAKIVEQYIRNLAQVYQYTLPCYDQKLVGFAEEWAFVKANSDLLKTRFGDCLNIVLEQEAALRDVRLPPLTLQLLVENVMKHNHIDKANKVTITISRTGNWWFIVNNKTMKPNNVSSFRIGLDNIIDRYALLGDRKVRVIDGDIFTVKLPVL